MPDGSEKMLRAEWKKIHGFNLNGSWLTSEDVMAKIYKGLNSSDGKSLFIPDVTAILRRSNLSQKPKSGTLITEDGTTR